MKARKPAQKQGSSGTGPTASATRSGSDVRWHAVMTRDASADGRFFYSVKTTGVYCRPSCPARRPKPENLAFHASAQAAEKAGFRPCKRCRPTEGSLLERRASLVTQLCRFIEQSPVMPSLEQLANQVGLSTFHLHRLFKETTGLTPRAYAAAHRARRTRSAVARARTVTEAIYEAGYSSNGRFYENSNQLLGMTPTRYRAGGTSMDIRFAVGECSLGSILVAATERGVCAILLGDAPEALVHDLERRFPKSRLKGADPGFESLVATVVRLVERPTTSASLPLDIRGTAFQQRVWEALKDIPAGKTLSYTELAQRIGQPRAVRAVARACASNPIAVAIPCHRVLSTSGDLSGYRWGIERKRMLLDREAEKSPSKH